MDKQGIILIGGGGHCKSCIDVIEQEGRFGIVGIIDAKEHIGKKVLGYEIIGCDDDLASLAKKYDHFFITIGQIKSAASRIKIFHQLKKIGQILPTIISPLAYVSPHAQIGEGTIIMHQAMINSAVVIGDNCIVNSKALVEHDVVIGHHNHLSTASVLNGQVQIGNACTIGSSSTIIQNIVLADAIILGAGAVVRQDLTEAGVYVGVPAKKIK